MSRNWKNVRAGFLIHTLELKLWHFEVVEAMHLQCFPPTLRECALFRKRVLLDHVLAEYGLGYSVWFLDMA